MKEAHWYQKPFLRNSSLKIVKLTQKIWWFLTHRCPGIWSRLWVWILSSSCDKSLKKSLWLLSKGPKVWVFCKCAVDRNDNEFLSYLMQAPEKNYKIMVWGGSAYEGYFRNARSGTIFHRMWTKVIHPNLGQSLVKSHLEGKKKLMLDYLLVFVK